MHKSQILYAQWTHKTIQIRTIRYSRGHNIHILQLNTELWSFQIYTQQTYRSILDKQIRQQLQNHLTRFKFSKCLSNGELFWYTFLYEIQEVFFKNMWSTTGALAVFIKLCEIPLVYWQISYKQWTHWFIPIEGYP